ncbi:MAG: glyoxalase [Alteromonadaceae bacterium]|nr:MAG: glyoxalase [Alteromonadaceae bacterium]
MKKYLNKNSRIDHIAIAVKNLEQALFLYEGLFGFTVVKRREIKGVFSGMKSAELDAGGFSVVLLEGTDPESQISRYIDEYGPGVQHVAIEVDDVESLTGTLSESGVKFSTNIIRGDGLTQRFTQRDENSGMMIEFIQRSSSDKGFDPASIQKLFEQLEADEAY